jgi:glycosyltransferase involved in cell wall biosynthesis
VRILVLAQQWFPDYAGGTARVVRATAEGLARRGHEIVLIVPSFAGEPEISIVNGVEVRRVMRQSFLPTTMTDVYETRRAIKGLGTRQFDVVLAHHVACATGAQGLNLECPLALVFHASPFREARHRRSTGLTWPEQLRSLTVEPLLYIQERIALKRADRIFVLSNYSRRLVLEFNARVDHRIEIVGGGVDVETFGPAPDRDALRTRLGIEPDHRLLVTARRLVGRMGLEMLLTAFRELYDQDENIQLVVIGEGELLPALERQRDQLNLHRSVRFTGRVSDAELRDWYCAADVFVLPTVAYEGFGMVTAEALACGTPVVGTRVGATSEILAPLREDLLADEANAASLVSAISRALTWASPATRTACYRYAQQRLSWDHVLDRWEQTLAQLTATI